MEVEEQKIRGEVSIFFYIIYNIRKNRIRKWGIWKVKR
jgi:hypothetical protein